MSFPKRIEISSHEAGSWTPVEVLADTGAFLTWLPASLLDDIGVARIDRRLFEWPDGSTDERDVGEAIVRLDGRRGHTIVVFGRDDERGLLGWHTLDALALKIDDAHQKLLPMGPILAATPFALDS